ncbi:hypothetical protein BaRGS_00039102 [Batillaria attramentaria]|uniref:Uncharacterized protein n=1 Tax=Batillaria attramentaria TaxID=370345 RepID=A0ABD0J494_9CAEN
MRVHVLQFHIMDPKPNGSIRTDGYLVVEEGGVSVGSLKLYLRMISDFVNICVYELNVLTGFPREVNLTPPIGLPYADAFCTCATCYETVLNFSSDRDQPAGKTGLGKIVNNYSPGTSAKHAGSNHHRGNTEVTQQYAACAANIAGCNLASVKLTDHIRCEKDGDTQPFLRIWKKTNKQGTYCVYWQSKNQETHILTFCYPTDLVGAVHAYFMVLHGVVNTGQPSDNPHGDCPANSQLNEN